MFFGTALTILLLDQVTKWWVIRTFEHGESLPVIPGLLYFTHVQNAGGAFGLLQNQRWLFICMAILLVAAAWWFREELGRQSLTTKWGVTLGLAGATGNLLDRIRLGKVVDFVDMRVWPVFNVADMSIVAGVVLLFFVILRSGSKAGDPQPEGSPTGTSGGSGE